MAEKIEVSLTFGVFAGFLNGDGKLLIQRRKEKGSIIPGKEFYRDYELPGGGLTQEEMEQLRQGAPLWALRYFNDDFNHLPSEIILPTPQEVLASALKREAVEEEGLAIGPHVISISNAYRAILVQKKLIKIDTAISVPIDPSQWSGTPTGEIEWVDAERIKELSQKPKGEQILSGWGKRMCQMMLWCLIFSCDLDIRKRAENYLKAIQKEKGYPGLFRETLSIID